MSRKRNLKIQLHQKLDSMLMIGESKHDAKKFYKQYCQDNDLKYNPSKSFGIHSISTAENYRQVLNGFGDWLRENRPDVWETKDLSNIDKSVAYEYLRFRDETNSAWSTSKDMSAINKLLPLSLTKEEGGLKKRRLEDIKRSREPVHHDKEYNPKNYENQILVARSFGLRRESIFGGDYQIKDVSLFSRDGKLYCSVIEKGGRYREAVCIEAYEESIKSAFDIQERDSLNKNTFKELYESSEVYLFDDYTSKVDNHAFRSEYAVERYNELVEGTYFDSDKRYKGYLVSALEDVSQSLGHNRISVVVDYYLR